MLLKSLSFKNSRCWKFCFKCCFLKIVIQMIFLKILFQSIILKIVIQMIFLKIQDVENSRFKKAVIEIFEIQNLKKIVV